MPAITWMLALISLSANYAFICLKHISKMINVQKRSKHFTVGGGGKRDITFMTMSSMKIIYFEFYNF